MKKQVYATLALLLTASFVSEGVGANKETPVQKANRLLSDPSTTFETALGIYFSMENTAEQSAPSLLKRDLWNFLTSRAYSATLRGSGKDQKKAVPFAHNRKPTDKEISLIKQAIDKIKEMPPVQLRLNATSQKKEPYQLPATVTFDAQYLTDMGNLVAAATYQNGGTPEEHTAFRGQLLRYYIIANRDKSVGEIKNELVGQVITPEKIESFYNNVKDKVKTLSTASNQSVTQQQATGGGTLEAIDTSSSGLTIEELKALAARRGQYSGTGTPPKGIRGGNVLPKPSNTTGRPPSNTTGQPSTASQQQPEQPVAIDMEARRKALIAIGGATTGGDGSRLPPAPKKQQGPKKPSLPELARKSMLELEALLEPASVKLFTEKRDINGQNMSWQDYYNMAVSARPEAPVGKEGTKTLALGALKFK